MEVSAHPLAADLFYCANCQCFHRGEISLCRDKAKAQPHTGGGMEWGENSFLSQGCRVKRDGKYKETRSRFRICFLQPVEWGIAGRENKEALTSGRE